LIKELTEKFAAVNLDDADSLYSAAFENFRSGNIEAAHNTLNPEALKKNVSDAKKELQKIEQLEEELEQRKQKAHRNVEKTIESYKLKADIFVLQMQWEDAECFYVLNNLAILYSDKNNYPSAESAYKRALEIYERLAANNPQTYEPDVATTLNNLAILYYDKNNYPSAESAYKRALEIYERLAANNPQTYEPDVATTLNNLGFLYKAWLEATADKSYRKKGLDYILQSEKVLKTCPDIPVVPKYNKQVEYLVEYFNTVKQDYLLAEKYRKEADRLLQQQAAASKIFTKLKESAKYYEQLLPDDPELDYAWGLSLVYESLVSFGKTNSEKTDFAQKTIKLRQKVYTKFQNKNTALQLANAYGYLSWYLLFEKRLVKAEEAALAGLNISGFEKPEGFDKQVEWIHTNLATSLLYQGKYKDAEKIYKKYMNKPYNEEKTWKEIFLADLDELEKAGITHPDVKKIRELLTK